ncbi:MAG: S-methyl-5-thioribose kinase [Chloroflexota bacterium]|jgi:5-methylthioribose kinase
MSSIPPYELLSIETVPKYIAGRPDLYALVDPRDLHVREIGDGNLNLVFIAQDGQGRGICLKQSLPYVRLVGESWPLTPHRATAEARAYDAAVAAAPEHVPDYYGFDAERFILAMADLSAWAVWRTALNAGEIHRGVAWQMGDYVGRVAFSTSVFGMEIEDMQRAAASAINPDLCRITEDLVFTEPYIDHEHNSVHPDVEPEVARLRGDTRLIAEVGGLKYRFITAAQALIHGDLHTGSVMVRHVPADEGGTGEDGEGKAIDGEFCYYGPVGFDIGALMGNYLAAMARAKVLDRPAEFQSFLRGLAAESWSAFDVAVRERWPDRADHFYSDEMLEDWIGSVWRDSVGFGGCKAIRRIVGLAKVSDIESLEGAEHVAAATIVLRVAHRWIVERERLDHPADLMGVFDEVVAEVLS